MLHSGEKSKKNIKKNNSSWNISFIKGIFQHDYKS